jgi:hypothetical protein
MTTCFRINGFSKAHNLDSSLDSTICNTLVYVPRRLPPFILRAHLNLSFVVYGDYDLTGKRVSCHGVPMFHAMGMLESCVAVRGFRCVY